MLDDPLVDDRFLETPLLSQFRRRNFLLLCPGVNGLGFQLEVGRYLLQCHDVVFQFISSDAPGAD